jgi:ABC-type transport system involved in multi-copper enzyme maturation permease subunit
MSTTIVQRLSLRGRLPSLRFGSGISAIIVKELRGRMRGRRAFIIVTLYLLLLAVFAWMLQRSSEEEIGRLGSGYGGQATYASATVGRAIFTGLLMLQTLMVAVLAPAATAGAISSEREHQTLEMLSVTPISSLAIIVGKLVSALAWVFVLILASIPVTALVFVFGGVAPDDVLRGYVVLFATAIGLGSVGLFFSAVTRRTGASTGLTFITTIALVLGSLYVFDFLGDTAETSFNGLRKAPPEAILYLNPFIAQSDVACGTEDSGFGEGCMVMAGVLGTAGQVDLPDFLPGGPEQPRVDQPFPGRGIVVPFDGLQGPDSMEGGKGPIQVLPGGVGAAGGDDVVNAAVNDPWRDRFWPKSVMSFLFLALVMTLASVQLVTPTRRWRPSLPGPVRRLINRRSA